MKKKIFAILSAAAMLCGCLAAPVSAAGTYKMGDVNMDGAVDLTDAMQALMEYCRVFVTELPSEFTADQRELAAVFPERFYEKAKITSKDAAMLEEAQSLLYYYTAALTDESVKDQDAAAWCDAYWSAFYEKKES